MDLFLLGTTAAKIGFILVIIFTFAPVLVWAERRQSAMMQDRTGPTRAGFRIFGKEITIFGLLHPLADALKFVWKEDFVPPGGDKLLHALAPIIAMIPAIAVFTVIPFGPTLYPEYFGQVLPAAAGTAAASGEMGPAIDLQIASLNVGILFIFAIGGTGVIGAAIAGYVSDNKYALLGGLRAAGQMVSYEVTLGLSLVGAFMVYDTLLLDEMVRWQISNQLWGVFVQPVAFIIFLTAAIAEAKRIPFDVPEGESEIVAGYFVEYSGMKFGMFMFGEFIEIIGSSALIAVLFFGGWDVPFMTASGFEVLGYSVELAHGWLVAFGVLAFVLKTIVFIWLQLQIRWTLPRFRYDQIMRMCWQYLLPLSLINIFVTGIGVLWLGN